MDCICKICEQEFKSLGGLHNHLVKSEGTCQVDYYEKYFPKIDPYNSKPIPYKNYDDYRERNFTDKKSEFSFIMKNGVSDALVKNLLSLQLINVAGKSGGRFPTYCEWRSSKNIRYDYLEKVGIMKDFLNLFLKKVSGAKINFNYLSSELKVIKKDLPVLIDTREQKPLFDGEKTTINVGDYTLTKENYNGVHIDRKSKADFIGTFTAGYDRFVKECEKAKQMDVDLVVLVEESFSECFRYRPLKFTKQVVTGENAFNGVRRISRQFNNVQFLFVQDREEAKKYIKLVLNNKEIVKGYDLQFLYETGRLK